MIYITKEGNRKAILNRILVEVERQERQWGKEKELTPHQFLGLALEELGETAQALNETCLPSKYITKPELGGVYKIENEAFQTMALLFRLIEKLEEERLNESLNDR